MSSDNPSWTDWVDARGNLTDAREILGSRLAPKISVIIPHYSDLKGLDACLKALQNQNYPTNDFEVVVADNASPCGEIAVANLVAGRARIVIANEKGAGLARNIGVSVSRGRILAFVDSDCRPEPDWLAEGVRALERYDFVGGQVKVLVDDPKRMSAAEAFESVFAFDFKTYITRKGFAGAGNLFCARTLFDRVGGFRTGVSEDVEWSGRARAAGYQLGYAPKAIVGHPARKSWEELRSKWRRVTAETYRLHSMRKGGRLRWLLRSSLLPISALMHSPRVLVSPELHSFHQRMIALGMLYRIRFWRLWESLRVVKNG